MFNNASTRGLAISIALLNIGANPNLVTTIEGLSDVYLNGTYEQAIEIGLPILLERARESTGFIQIDTTGIPEREIPEELQELKAARAAARRPYIKAWWGEVPLMYTTYPTPYMAEQNGLTQQEYWNDFLAACRLNVADPVAEWKSINTEKTRIIDWLNDLEIDELHIEGADSDLKVRIGDGRKWIHAGKQNMPSLEI